jgi:hypothetical protein
MDNPHQSVSRPPRFSRPWGRVLLAAVALPLWSGLTGCAALTNPVAHGVPVERVPPELLGKPKDPEHTIPLTLLGQVPPDTYRLGAGDVLGVWVEGALGDRNVSLPLHVAPQVQTRDQRRLAPAAGYPVAVDEDGTVSLPLVGAVAVDGLSVAQAREAIRTAYTSKKLLPAGRENVLVTLLQPRQYHVVVMRQEAGSFLGADTLAGSSKRGTGHVIDLPAYENDVLHALAQTGGLPGLDALDSVLIYRGYFGVCPSKEALQRHLETAPGGGPCPPAAGLTGHIIHIPLRARPGEPPPVRPEDIVLQTGDVVFLEARDCDVFYTGGLLPGGEFVLPRDRDLDVVEAVARVKGPLLNGGIATNNLAGNLIAPGIGAPSPSLLVVLRRLPGGGRLPIRVDLDRALSDPHECIRVQPGDVLILQEKPSQALVRYFSQTFLNFSLTSQVLHSRFATGVVDVSAPQQIPARIGVTQFIGPPP